MWENPGILAYNAVDKLNIFIQEKMQRDQRCHENKDILYHENHKMNLTDSTVLKTMPAPVSPVVSSMYLTLLSEADIEAAPLQVHTPQLFIQVILV